MTTEGTYTPPGNSRTLVVAGSTLVVFALLALALLGVGVLPAPYQPYVLPGLLLGTALLPGGWIVWRRPVWGLAVVLLLVAVPWGEDEGRGVSVTPADLLALAITGLVMLRVLLGEDDGRPRSWVMMPLLGIVAAGVVSVIASIGPSESLVGLVRYVQIFVAVPLAVYFALRSRSDQRLILITVLALGIFEGILGTYQYFTGTGAEFGESGGSRAVGTFGAYGIMGLAQLVTYALLVATAAFAVLRDGLQRTVALLLMAGLCLPLAFSLSRGFWIAAAAGIFTILALQNWRMLVALLIAGVMLIGAYSAVTEGPNVFVERFTSIFDSGASPDQSVQDRYALWTAAQDMWADHPVTGVGMKNFPTLLDTYVPLNFSGGSDISDPTGGYRRVEILSPHSLYWLIVAEQGVLGALAYGTLFLSLGVASVRRIKRLADDSTERVFGLACLGVFVSYLVSGIYNDIGGVTEMLNSVFFGGLLWLASGAGLSKED